MKRIAIIRLSSLGDIVHTIPAAALLKKKFPDSRLSWFVEPPGDELLQSFSGIDDIIPACLRRQGLWRAWKNARRLKKKYRDAFDVVLDFQGLIKSALLSRYFRGEHLGFHKKNLREPLAGHFYDRKAAHFDESRHVILKNLHLLTLLGVQEQDISYPLKEPVPSPGLQEFLGIHGLRPRSWLALNVGGGWPTKILQPYQWREVITALATRFPVILIWGSGQEKAWAGDAARQTRALLAPRLSFSDLIWFIRESGMLVSADTLALHLADAVQTPSLGLFGPTSPQRNGSLMAGSMALREDVGCGFCYRRRCDTIRCMKALTTEKIAAAIMQMMEKNGRIHH